MAEFEGIEVFTRTVEAGSFSAAARKLGITPSAVSRHIARLEERLGSRLFERTTRRMRPTEVGHAFYARCTRVLSDLREAELAVTAHAEKPSGVLRISLPMAFGRRQVVPLLAEYMERFPEVKLDLSFGDHFVDLVQDGYDLAVRIGELSDSSLIAKRIANNRRVLAASPAYIAKHGAPESPADLKDHDCLDMTLRNGRNWWRFRGPDGKEFQADISGRLMVNNAEAARELALTGLCLALLPLWLIGPDLESGRLVEVLAEHHAADSAVYIVYPPGRHLSPKVRSFIDYVSEHFRGDVPWCIEAESKETAGSEAAPAKAEKRKVAVTAA